MTNITSQITVSGLFARHGDRFRLSCVAGQQGLENIIFPEESDTNPSVRIGDDPDKEHLSPSITTNIPRGKSLVGYLNLIHPHQIQILGNVELQYIEGLRDITRHDAVRQLFKHKPACIIIADDK